MSAHVHAPDGADTCFGCKMTYWRAGGAPMKFTWGRADFHGPTIRERRERAIAEARRGGHEAEPVGVRWV